MSISASIQPKSDFVTTMHIYLSKLSVDTEMDVIFQPSKGNPFCIEVGYFDTVLEIKEKIHKDQNIPIDKQTLIFNGNVLRDDLNVHDSDILDQSRIHLSIASDQTTTTTNNNSKNNHNHGNKKFDSRIQLVLKMPSSSKLGGTALETDTRDTVGRLKERIREMEGMAANRLTIHANGVELLDHRSVHECQLSDNSEIDVGVIRSPPVSVSVSVPTPAPTSSGSSSGNNAGGSRKMRIVVVNKCGAEKIPVDVSSSDNVGELRNKLQKLKLDLPREGYFFIFKQNVMDDDRSFRWHHVGHGDAVEIFGGSVSGGL